MRPPAWLAAVLTAVLLLVPGCVAIPTSGPIGTGEVVVTEPGAAIPLAGDDPGPDASPEEIVGGFLAAGAGGVVDEFTVARRYLTVTASAEWDPRARVLVYEGGGPVIERQEDGGVVVTVPVAATVDRGGRYVEAMPGAREEVVFELMRDSAGQWRISRLDDGVLMSGPNFDSLYRRTAVYFATPDREHLVPEVRWFPSRNQATYAVEALLAGPSPWLRDAVVTGVPEGVRLSGNAVTVNRGVAQVDLSAEARTASAADRGLLQAQVEAVLQRLPGVLVTEVAILVEGVPWEAPAVPRPGRDVGPETGPYVLQEDHLAVLERGELVPVDGAPSLAGIAASSPALSPDGSVRVVLDGTTRLLHLPPRAGAPQVLVAGTSLVAPSVDRFGWVWTGESASDGLLRVVAPRTGADVAVPVEWLAGRTVHAVRVSRDGARVAVASTAPDGTTTVEVAGVVRDEEDAPRVVGEPLAVGAGLEDLEAVTWVDEGQLAVLGRAVTQSVPTMHLVPLGGPSQSLPLVDETVGIAAGRGERALYAVSRDGVLYWRQNLSWVVVAEGVRDPVFPG